MHAMFGQGRGRARGVFAEGRPGQDVSFRGRSRGHGTCAHKLRAEKKPGSCQATGAQDDQTDSKKPTAIIKPETASTGKDKFLCTNITYLFHIICLKFRLC